MVSVRNCIAALTLASFVMAQTPAAAEVEASWTVEQVRARVSYYNEHLRIDSGVNAFAPAAELKKDPDLQATWNFFRKAAKESGLTQLPKATAQGTNIAFDLGVVPEGKGRALTADFSSLSSGALLVNGKPVEWNAKTPFDQRIQRLRSFLEKEYGKQHASAFSLIPEAYALDPITILIICGIVAILAAILIPHVGRSEVASEEQKLDVDLRGCEQDKLIIETEFNAVSSASKLQSDALQDLRNNVQFINASLSSEHYRKLCEDAKKAAKAGQVCEKFRKALECHRQNVELIKTSATRLGGEVSAEQTSKGTFDEDSLSVRIPSTAGRGE